MAFGAAAIGITLAAAWIYILIRVANDMDDRGQPGLLWALGMCAVPYVALIFYLIAKRRYPLVDRSLLPPGRFAG